MTTATALTSIERVTLEVPDIAAATAFYAGAFGLGDELALRQSEAPTSGFRGFTLSLVVPQPSTADALFDAALQAGATAIKPVKKSFWGYGGSLRAPDGTIWKVATPSKKETGAPTGQIDEVVLLLGASDVKASKRFYEARGFGVDKSFGSKYVQFEDGGSRVKLALYSRSALAKDAGVPADGTGSHRLAIQTGAGAFTDPDGFAWEPAA